MNRQTLTWPLELGATRPCVVRRAAVALDLPTPVRLLYASDLHFGNRWSPRVVDEVVDATERARPDVLLLGGDLCDSPGGLRWFRLLLARVTTPVGITFGNHDRRYRHALRRLGGSSVRFLDESPIDLAGGRRIVGQINQVRTGDVLCGHDPADFPAAVARGAALVLAGHLHGGQCVLWNDNSGRQWPGVMINRWTRTHARRNDTTLLVSRGLADTLPLRWNCPREMLLVTLA